MIDTVVSLRQIDLDSAEILAFLAVNSARRISLKAMNTPRKISSSLLLLVALVGASHLQAQTPRSSCDKIDWSTLPSRFTHDESGQRVHQYAEKVQPVVQVRSDFQRSGFRQYRSSIQVGSSADNLNVVEQWGGSIQPYEAWRFPYRPYGVPYDQWGPNTQFWGANSYWPGAWPVNPVQPWANPSGGHPPHHSPAGPHDPADPSMPSASMPSPVPPGYYPPGYYPPGYGHRPHWNVPNSPWNPGPGPWTDGYYQDAPERPRMPDRQFFYTPNMAP